MLYFSTAALFLIFTTFHNVTSYLANAISFLRIPTVEEMKLQFEIHYLKITILISYFEVEMGFQTRQVFIVTEIKLKIVGNYHFLGQK